MPIRSPGTPVLQVRNSPPPTQLVSVNENLESSDSCDFHHFKDLVKPSGNTIQQSMQSHIRQAPSIFQEASFHGCTINFQMPQNK